MATKVIAKVPTYSRQYREASLEELRTRDDLVFSDIEEDTAADTVTVYYTTKIRQWCGALRKVGIDPEILAWVPNHGRGETRLELLESGKWTLVDVINDELNG